MRATYATAFARVYSVEDLRGILAFYRSPAGAAMIRKMPDAMKVATPQLQSVMGAAMKRIQERASKLADELRAAQ